MRTLLDIKDPQALMGGLFPNLAPNQPALWRRGNNVIFKDGKVEKAPGYVQAYSFASGGTGDKILGLSQSHQSASYYNGSGPADIIWIGTGTKLYAVANYARGITTLPFAISDTLSLITDYLWSLEPFGNFLVAAQRGRATLIWQNNSSMAAAISGAPAEFEFVKKWNNHLLGFRDTTLYWPSKDTFDDWTPTAENSAGDLFVRDADSKFRSCQPLGQAYGLYTADSLFALTYGGSVAGFGAVLAINGIGALSDPSVVPVGRKNYGVCRKGFFVTDGIDFKYVDGPAVNEYFQATIDWTKSRLTVGFHDEVRKCVTWWYTDVNAARIGMTYFYEMNSWSIFTGISVSAAVEQQVYDAPIIGNGLKLGMYGLDVNIDSDVVGEAPHLASIQSFRLDAGERDRFKRWDMLRVDGERMSGTEIRFGFSDIAEDPDHPTNDIEWGAWTALALENWIHRDAVHLAVEIRATALDSDFRVGGLKFMGELGGFL